MRKKVLIADDEPNIVRSLQFLMTREGFEVLVAADGEDALEQIAAHRPDVVLLDVMMPKKNGYEVCQLVRANAEWHAIRVILLTAKGRDVDVEKGMAMGADAYVTKPFGTKELVAQVKDILGPR
jgi:DNA-binding response OmpR family regulator